jgi:hypothetical protein
LQQEDETMTGPIFAAVGGLAAAGVAPRNKRENRELPDKLERGKKEREAADRKQGR